MKRLVGVFLLSFVLFLVTACGVSSVGGTVDSGAAVDDLPADFEPDLVWVARRAMWYAKMELGVEPEYRYWESGLFGEGREVRLCLKGEDSELTGFSVWVNSSDDGSGYEYDTDYYKMVVQEDAGDYVKSELVSLFGESCKVYTRITDATKDALVQFDYAVSHDSDVFIPYDASALSPLVGSTLDLSAIESGVSDLGHAWYQEKGLLGIVRVYLVNPEEWGNITEDTRYEARLSDVVVHQFNVVKNYADE